MDAELKNKAIKLLTKHEGYRTNVYLDTRGLETIGIGRNISPTGPGLRDSEIQFMLTNDITDCFAILAAAFPWFEHLDINRQAVMIDLLFNLGFKGLQSFKLFLGAMQIGHWQMAAQELLNSSYAKQVKNRASENAYVILSGEF